MGCVFDSESRYTRTRTIIHCVFAFADYRGDVNGTDRSRVGVKILYSGYTYTEKAEKKNRIRRECSRRKAENCKGAGATSVCGGSCTASAATEVIATDLLRIRRFAPLLSEWTLTVN